jgi:hypothetical protein
MKLFNYNQFQVNSSIQNNIKIDHSQQNESLYMHLLRHWLGLFSDTKNVSLLYIPYVSALHVMKSIFSSTSNDKFDVKVNFSVCK